MKGGSECDCSLKKSEKHRKLPHGRRVILCGIRKGGLCGPVLSLVRMGVPEVREKLAGEL